MSPRHQENHAKFYMNYCKQHTMIIKVIFTIITPQAGLGSQPNLGYDPSPAPVPEPINFKLQLHSCSEPMLNFSSAPASAPT